MTDTDYLLSTEANKERLLESIAQFKSNKTKEYELEVDCEDQDDCVV